MEILDLYKEENKDLLYYISWLNKNSIYDKSIGKFKDIDLFTFLENINKFDYNNEIYFDDIYYIIEYTQDSILHLISNINKEMKREHKIVPISQAKELDKKSVLWISRQNGRTLREKLSKGKIKSVQRYKNIDTYENRIFKIFLKNLLEVYELRNDIKKFELLFTKIRRWLKSDEADNINEYKNIVYNNILLHHPHYSKIFKSYKKIYRLDEKYNNYLELYPSQMHTILKFEVLSQLQFKTSIYVLPNSIKVKRKKFEINMINPLINIDLDELLNKVYKKNKKEFTSIRSFIENELKTIKTENRTFKLETNFDEVYIDLFRLFPIASIKNKTINFPITLKQKIDGNIINANNTKIVDLDHELYTLPEILDTFNIDILKYFLEDFSKTLNRTKLNYIIPDYVNVFEFTESKRMINTYFKKNKPIPKSILAGLEYLFSSNVQKDDTLIYIQRNHHNELYVTPLLVKYDSKLKDITNGYYLERYPTKKIGIVNDGLLNSLNNIFEENFSKILLNKFLQNGLKGIKKENIVFYQDNNIIDLTNLKISHEVYEDTKKIKKLYSSKNLFKTDYEYLNDTNEENLINFEKLLQYEKQGSNLWREHLPDLSIEIVRNGVYEQFVLVDETSELNVKSIKIDNHFLIPHGVKELSFPLTFGDEKINYRAYLSSKDFPYSQNVECQLDLTYDFERENPYELIFRPLDKEYKDINVEWKQQSYNNIELPIPNFPIKTPWENFKNDIRPNGKTSDLFNWIFEGLESLTSIFNRKEGIFLRGNTNRFGNYFCFVKVGDEQIYCSKKDFAEEIDISELCEGMSVYLNIKQKENGKTFGKFVTFRKRVEPLVIVEELRKIRPPLLKVWNNHSLLDNDVPESFRNDTHKYINLSLKYLAEKNTPERLKVELFYFLSILHQDTPIQVANKLVEYSTNLQHFMNLALSIGDCTLDWQKQVLENSLNHFRQYQKDERFFTILAISLWRSEILINKISQENIEKIIYNLLPVLKKNFKTLSKEFSHKNVGNLVKKLELLLGLLRARNNFDFLYPHEQLTLQYTETLDEIIKYIIDNKINIKTRIHLDIVKPESFSIVPNILYALRVYLTADTGAANSIKVLGVSDD